MSTKKLVFCAATPPEFTAIQKATDNDVVLTGVGAKKSAATLRRWLSDRAAAGEAVSDYLVVSSGFCGALTAELKVGDFVTTNTNGDESLRLALVLSSDEVIAAGTKKAEIFLRNGRRDSKSSLPICVDMESEALASVAKEFGADFKIIRMVSDTPENPLPNFVALGTKAVMEDRPKQKLALFAATATSALTDPVGLFKLVRSGMHWQSQLTKGIRAWLDSPVTRPLR